MPGAGSDPDVAGGSELGRFESVFDRMACIHRIDRRRDRLAGVRIQRSARLPSDGSDRVQSDEAARFQGAATGLARIPGPGGMREKPARVAVTGSREGERR
jgi:hypothetical protein